MNSTNRGSEKCIEILVGKAEDLLGPSDDGSVIKNEYQVNSCAGMQWIYLAQSRVQ
jgi:hypothetical protein